MDGGGRGGGISGAGRQFARGIGVVVTIMNGNETFAPSIRVLFGISQMIRSPGLNERVSPLLHVSPMSTDLPRE